MILKLYLNFEKAIDEQTESKIKEGKTYRLLSCIT